MPRAVTRAVPSEIVPCNLCGASDYEVVGRRDRDGRPLQTVLCRACGLVWTNPRPTAAEIDRYYEAEYRPDYTGAAAPAPRKLLRGLLGARERRDALRTWLRPGAVLLDVGCGAGELVYLLRRAGIDASGLEPGGEYARFAQQVLGIPVQTATVDTAAVAPASLDVVTMYHSLEHVADPQHVLAHAGTWLHTGGLVVVEVPNVESTVQAPAHRYHYAHLYHFSGTTLAAIGEAAGLRVVRTDYSPDGGNVTCVFRRETGERRPPPDLRAAAGRTLAVLRSHTSARHYVSPTPYRRALGRLARRRHEDRLLGRLRTAEAIVRWAEAL
jgi:2-polyprenyl-3-methyl-5-hydroxy-6-metoxy-1,4-benzoquinol methylase